MRRISAYLCAAAFALLSVLPADAANDYAFETMLTPSTDDASVGDIVTVECNVYGITDVNGLIAIDTTVEYDPAILEYQDTEVLFPELWTGDNEDLTRAEVGADGKGRVFLSFANDGRPGKGRDRRHHHREAAIPRQKRGGDDDEAAHLQRRQHVRAQRSGRDGLRKGLRRRSAHRRGHHDQNHHLLRVGRRYPRHGAAVYEKQEKAKAPARKEMRGKTT